MRRRESEKTPGQRSRTPLTASTELPSLCANVPRGTGSPSAKARYNCSDKRCSSKLRAGKAPAVRAATSSRLISFSAGFALQHPWMVIRSILLTDRGVSGATARAQRALPPYEAAYRYCPEGEERGHHDVVGPSQPCRKAQRTEDNRQQ